MAMARLGIKGEQQTCALRALMLCDGHLVEKPDRALTTCLCWLEERSDEADYPLLAAAAAAERKLLIDRTQTG